MVQKFIDAWNKEQQNLKAKLRHECWMGYDQGYTYNSLVRYAWTIATSTQPDDRKVDLKNMKIFGGDDYQGDYLFMAPLGTEYCGPGDYIYVFVGYGSCSYCDTLLAVQDDEDPEERAQYYWQMILNIIQQTKIME